MPKTTLKKTLLAAAAVTLILFAGAAVPSSAAAPQAAGKTVTLEYKLATGKALTYDNKTEMAQIMEVQGQSVNMDNSGTGKFTFKGKGLKDKNLLLGVTIDDMTASVTSVQGDMSPDLSGVKGKSFDMVLSPTGQELDVAGAEAISFDVAGESQSMGSAFKTFFPDLPGKPVKIGDTWPSPNSIDEKNGAVTIKTDLQNVNTLEGFETVDGMECARISTQFTGTISGSGNQGGMDLTFSGTTKGKNIWYFAVKEGVLVKQTSEGTNDISVDVSAMGMTIPMTQTTKSEVKLTAR
jgi:hypothetical protein